jgi:hypothetical protein
MLQFMHRFLALIKTATGCCALSLSTLQETFQTK